MSQNYIVSNLSKGDTLTVDRRVPNKLDWERVHSEVITFGKDRAIGMCDDGVYNISVISKTGYMQHMKISRGQDIEPPEVETPWGIFF